MTIFLLLVTVLCAAILPGSDASPSEPTPYQMLGIDVSSYSEMLTDLRRTTLDEAYEDSIARFDPKLNEHFDTMWNKLKKGNDPQDSKWKFLIKLCASDSSPSTCARNKIVPRIKKAYRELQDELQKDEKREEYETLMEQRKKLRAENRKAVATHEGPTHYQMLGIDASSYSEMLTDLRRSTLDEAFEDSIERFDPRLNKDFGTMWNNLMKGNDPQDSKWKFLITLCESDSSPFICARKEIVPRIKKAYSELQDELLEDEEIEEYDLKKKLKAENRKAVVTYTDMDHYKIFGLEPTDDFPTDDQFRMLFNRLRFRWDVKSNKNFRQDWANEPNQHVINLCRTYPTPEECARIQLIPRLEFAYDVLIDSRRRWKYTQTLLRLQAPGPSATTTMPTSNSRGDPPPMFPESLFPNRGPVPNFSEMFNNTAAGAWAVGAGMFDSENELLGMKHLEEWGHIQRNSRFKRIITNKRSNEKRLKRKLSKEWRNFLKDLPLSGSSIYPTGIRGVQVEFINEIPAEQRKRKLLQDTPPSGAQLTANIEYMSNAVEGRDMENDVKKTVQENSNNFKSKALPGYRLDPNSVTVQKVKLLKSDNSIWNVDQTMLVVTAALVTLLISFIIIGVYIRSRYRRVHGQKTPFRVSRRQERHVIMLNHRK